MHPYSFSLLARHQTTLRRHVWILTFALTLALFACFAQSQPAFAQTNCTAGRIQPVDRDGDTTDPGEIVTFEFCRQRRRE